LIFRVGAEFRCADFLVGKITDVTQIVRTVVSEANCTSGKSTVTAAFFRGRYFPLPK